MQTSRISFLFSLTNFSLIVLLLLLLFLLAIFCVECEMSFAAQFAYPLKTGKLNNFVYSFRRAIKRKPKQTQASNINTQFVILVKTIE